jgi:cell division protein FtsB
MKKGGIVRLSVIIVGVYLIITTLSGIVGLLRSGDKVTRRESELAELSKERRRLLIEHKKVQTRGYLEQIAYEKLGLSRPGEKVIIIPPELLASGNTVAKVKEVPNWKKWKDLLF